MLAQWHPTEAVMVRGAGKLCGAWVIWHIASLRSFGAQDWHIEG